MRAAELSAVPVVAQHTINRDWLARGLRDLVASGQADGAAQLPLPDTRTGASPRRRSHTRSTSPTSPRRKRAAMQAHASQMAPDHPLLGAAGADVRSSASASSSTSSTPLPSPAADAGGVPDLFTPLRTAVS